jgi:hypothetical protein
MYGRFTGRLRRTSPSCPDHYSCLDAGQTTDIRTRMLEHYNDLPIAGVTHFFVEAIVTEDTHAVSSFGQTPSPH